MAEPETMARLADLCGSTALLTAQAEANLLRTVELLQAVQAVQRELIRFTHALMQTPVGDQGASVEPPMGQ